MIKSVKKKDKIGEKNRLFRFLYRQFFDDFSLLMANNSSGFSSVALFGWWWSLIVCWWISRDGTRSWWAWTIGGIGSGRSIASWLTGLTIGSWLSGSSWASLKIHSLPIWFHENKKIFKFYFLQFRFFFSSKKNFLKTF